jgi:YjbR
MDPTDVPEEIRDELRGVCLGLPDAVEEEAWVGIRWRVRGRTFAHVLVVAAGWPPAYARAAATDGPATLLTFRSSGAELHALRSTGHPFFAPVWREDEVGLVLDGSVGRQEIGELLTESYCVQAPATLRRLVERP